MTQAARVLPFRSAQQEQIEDTTPRERHIASDVTIAAYVEHASDEVLECRIRGHRWPFTSKPDGFDDYDPATKLFINYTRCRTCKLVWRKEWWQCIGARRGHLEFELVATEPDYKRNPETGEQYLVTGEGYMPRKKIHAAVMKAAFSNKTAAELRKAALK